MTEEREAILELRKICKWLAGDNRWQDVWDKIDRINDKWIAEENCIDGLGHAYGIGNACITCGKQP